MADDGIRVSGLTKLYKSCGPWTTCRSRSAGPGDRVPRTQRGRQDDDAADAAEPGPADRRDGHHRGQRYADLPDPIRRVGAILEASGAHRGRSGRNHLRMLCDAAGIPTSRVDDVLAMVGLTPAAGRKFKGYSLGMRQRLGIAAALLGDPEVLILDEPANGLDPEGIRWMRDLLKGLADQGRTVLCPAICCRRWRSSPTTS